MRLVVIGVLGARTDVCPHCWGSGNEPSALISVADRCLICNGRGIIIIQEVPAEVKGERA